MSHGLPPRARRAFQLAVRRRDRTAADVDEELRFHLDQRIEQLVARGWSRADAEAEAQRRFGGSFPDAVRQLQASGRAREERLAMRERLHSWWYDLRYVARGLRAAPRFTTAAVLTLALGLAATTVIYSLVDRIVLRPLPWQQPERLVVVRQVVLEMRDVYPSIAMNAKGFLAMQQHCRGCEGMAAIKRSTVTLTGEGDPQRLGAARVSANLWSLLGVRPLHGREFTKEEERLGNDAVVVLSNAFWRRQYGADPGIVGRRITLTGVPVQVVGVLPPRVDLPGGDGLGTMLALPQAIDVYRPLALRESEAKSNGEFDFGVIVRLRPGVTPEALQAELDQLARDLAAQAGVTSGVEAIVTPAQRQIVGDAGRPLRLLLAAVAAVLLIVCVNLANLSLVRQAARRREAAVRVALGASRGRLVRLAMLESVLVALVGGALGVLLAHQGLGLLVAIAPPTLPRLGEVALDGRIVLASVALALLVGIAIGAIPAMRTADTAPGEALKSSSRSSTGGRAVARRRAAFIAAQVALSAVLLATTGLLVASLARVLGEERGFDTARTVALDVVQARGSDGDGQRDAYFRQAIAAVDALPGVTAAGLTTGLPLEGETWVDGIRPEGAPEDESQSANLRFVSPAYFDAVGTPVRRGRPLAEADRGRRVVVVSQRTARLLWPGKDPVGQRVVVGPPPRVAAEVVGVAADTPTSSLEQEGSLVVYLGYWEALPWQATIVARTTEDPTTTIAAARAALRRVDPTVPVAKLRTMEQVVAGATAARRFQVALLLVLAVMAFLTASIGIYGVIANSLAARGGEIGVRLALGAKPADVHRLVLREGMTPVLAGLALGLAVAVVVGRSLASLLYEVRPGDPLTLGGVALLLGLVAVVACLIPARRASSVDVTRMLRFE